MRIYEIRNSNIMNFEIKLWTYSFPNSIYLHFDDFNSKRPICNSPVLAFRHLDVPHFEYPMFEVPNYRFEVFSSRISEFRVSNLRFINLKYRISSFQLPNLKLPTSNLCIVSFPNCKLSDFKCFDLLLEITTVRVSTFGFPISYFQMQNPYFLSL